MIDSLRKVGRLVRARPVVTGGCALLLIVGVCGVALTLPRGPAVREVDPGGSFGASLPSRAGKPLTLGAFPVCLTEPGVAFIDAVTVIKARGGLAVTDYQVRPIRGNDRFGEDSVSLARSGFGGTKRVTTTCGGFADGSELAVELTKSLPENARGDGLLVRWHTAHRHGAIPMPIQIVLCEGPHENVPACDPG